MAFSFIDCYRDQLIEVLDEYEEREQRWNRIATLLHLDDLNTLESSVSSTTAGAHHE